MPSTRTIRNLTEAWPENPANFELQAFAAALADDRPVLSPPAFDRIEVQIAQELDRRQATARHHLIRKAEKLAQAEGMTLEEVLRGASPAPASARSRGRPRTAAPQRVLPLRYWNPDNPEQGWSGHARRPKWVLAWLENNGRLEDLERNPSSA